MPTQRFEGSTLEEALAKVRSSLGPDARITAADKVRQGGVGGFFAKERVEVTVEVDDLPFRPAGSSAAPGSTGLTGLTATVVDPQTSKPPASLLDLAESVSDEEQDVSTESTAFASVLERIANEAGDAVAAQTALDPAPTAQLRPEPQQPQQPQRPQPQPDALTYTPRTSGARTQGAPIHDASAEEAPVHQAMPYDAVAHEAAAHEAVTHEAITHEPMVHVAAVASPAHSFVPAAAIATPVRRPAAVPEAVRLSELGLPGSLLPADVSHGLHCALVEALRRLPQPPVLPAGKGSVLAVVGDRNDAVSMARDLSLDMQLDPEDVVICASRRRGRVAHSWLELTNPDDAEEHRRSWRWRMHPTIVVIEAAIGRPRPWARDMLAAIEPTAAWGVADASRKLEDVAAWSDQVGGLDALALNRTDDTTSPASILQLGVPVALVDGEPATAELWADLLIERLAA